ncbi:MAG: hypothetical protein ABEI86_04045 [Halobacteriaceae archaeon]
MIYGGFGDEWIHSPEERSADHAPEGVFLAAGPDITPGKCDATVYDIAPTLLALHNLPLVEGMDGEPLIEIFDGVNNPETSISPKTVQADPQSDSRNETHKSTDTNEIVEDRLENLGYL